MHAKYERRLDNQHTISSIYIYIHHEAPTNLNLILAFSVDAPALTNELLEYLISEFQFIFIITPVARSRICWLLLHWNRELAIVGQAASSFGKRLRSDLQERKILLSYKTHQKCHHENKPPLLLACISTSFIVISK